MADAAVVQQLFQRREEGEGLLRRTHLRLGDDLEQRRSRPVEIDPGAILEMKTPRDVFLEMNPGEGDFLPRRRYLLLRIFRIGEVMKFDSPSRAKRPRVLGDLIILGHVRVEIVLS